MSTTLDNCFVNESAVWLRKKNLRYKLRARFLILANRKHIKLLEPRSDAFQLVDLKNLASTCLSYVDSNFSCLSLYLPLRSAALNALRCWGIGNAYLALHVLRGSLNDLNINF